MHVIQCCCVVCLLLQVPSGTGNVTKSVCSEDSIVLFENVLNSRDTVVSIYMNRQKTHILIAEWEVKNLTIMSHIQPGYEEKFYLSRDGRIWLHNVNHWDEEKYFIVYGRDTSDVKYEVEIHVMVAPTSHCKPKITHGDKILIASLEVEDCGTPVVSMQWLDHPGISNTSEPMINLPPGNEAGTYYACLKGPALKCMKISMLSDYCSSYTIRGENLMKEIMPLQSTCIYNPVTIAILVIVVFITVVVVVPIFYKCACCLCKKNPCYKCKKNPCYQCKKNDLKSVNDNPWQVLETLGDNLHVEHSIPLMQMSQPRPTHDDNLHVEHSIPLLQMSQPRPTHDENVSGEQTVPLQKNCELWTKHFDSLKWEDIKQLLNDEQQQGLKNCCDNLQTREELVNDDQDQIMELYCDTFSTCEKLLNDEQQQVLGSYTDNLQTGEKPVNDDQHQVMELYSGIYRPTERKSCRDKLNWEDERQRLNRHQQQDLHIHIDSEHKTEDADTENPTCTGPEKVIELIEPHDDALCKICLVNTSSMIFLPCGHFATCANCSISVQECPVCGKQIKAVIRPYS